MTQRSLENFFDALRANQRANRINFAQWYAIIEKIDDCFVRAGKNLVNPKPVMTGGLLLRSQYAFKTAAGMALAGQVVEVFAILRSVLEHAGYCLTIYERPDLERVFILRHAGASEMATQKKEFKIGAVQQAVARHNPKLAELYAELYQRSIDFGGHPNPNATFSAMDLDESGGQTAITTFAISKDPKIVQHALKSTAQVGLTALHVLEPVFKERFKLLGIRQDWDIHLTGLGRMLDGWSDPSPASTTLSPLGSFGLGSRLMRTASTTWNG